MVKYITDIITKPELAGDQNIVDAFNRNKLFSELPDMVLVQVDDNPFFSEKDYWQAIYNMNLRIGNRGDDNKMTIQSS